MDRIVEIANKKHFFNYIRNNFKTIGFGSEGTAYIIGNKVIKILDGIQNRNYSIEEYLQFSKIKSNYIYFIKKIYIYNGKVIAVTSEKCPGKNLLRLNPLSVDINLFIKNYINLKKEVIDLSNMNINFYDVFCNCMYSKNQMGIIDTIDFSYSDECKDKILISNLSSIQNCFLDFLIEGYFNIFIYENKEIHDMYREIKNKNVNIYEEFLSVFKTNIEKIEQKEIKYLKEANKVIKKTKTNYPRFI